MAIVRVFEHAALPVVAVGRRIGDIVVVVVRAGLPSTSRHALVSELLTPDEASSLAGCDEGTG